MISTYCKGLKKEISVKGGCVNFSGPVILRSDSDEESHKIAIGQQRFSPMAQNDIDGYSESLNIPVKG